MQKIRKIPRAVSEKTAVPTKQPTNQPTNQPIITNNTDFIGPGWRRSKKFVSKSVFEELQLTQIPFSFTTSCCNLKFMEYKMENSTHAFRETNLVVQLI